MKGKDLKWRKSARGGDSACRWGLVEEATPFSLFERPTPVQPRGSPLAAQRLGEF